MPSDYKNTPLDKVSENMGTVKVTLAAGVGQGNGGTEQPCRSCIVKPASGNTATTYINFGSTADADDFPLDDSATPFPVSDVSDLYFYSTDVDAIVHIFWRQ